MRVEDTATGVVSEDRADVVLNCAGVLKRWKWPDIAGLHLFAGTLAHTGNYPPGLDLAGKRVAVIGAGSSAIQVVPKFDVGCNRVTPGEGYLEALQEANVELVRDGIAEVTAAGVVTARGKTYEADVIIAATGYDTSYVPAFAVTGRAGVDLG